MTDLQIAHNEQVEEARRQIAYVGRMLFDRKLTDAAGGNISVRVGDVVCMSPTLAGQKRQWQLNPEDVLIVDLDMNIIVGEGGLTREANVHFGLHRTYPDYGTAVIHAHPQNLMVFACANREMPPVQEATRKFGTIPLIEYAPAHSPELAKRIVASMEGREHRIKKHAAGTIAPWHGLFLMGKTLYAAFDAVERLDNNAYTIIMGQMLGTTPMLKEESAAMETAITPYES
jgi:L-fuculose-phosphate aldolase